MNFHAIAPTRRQTGAGWPILLALAVAVAVGIGLAGPADAQYTYTEVDPPGSLAHGVYPGTVNNLGEVAFTAFPTSNSVVIYKGSGGPATTIASTGTDYTFFNAPAINCNGEVAFRAVLATPGNGVYRGNGGPLTDIHTATNGVGGENIDNDGTVAVWDNSIGILIGDGGPPTVVAPLGGQFAGVGSDPDIRNGTVAFATVLAAGQSAIYTWNSGVLSQVDISGGQVTALQLPRIGPLGSLVWFANLQSGVQEIRKRVNGVVSPFVDTSGPYSQFGFYWGASINYYNDIVFSAILDTQTGLGIYTGPDPVLDKVIGPGDPLAGKTVRDAYLGGINDLGQVSFGVMFSDFTYGMFRADPISPNPAPGPCVYAGACCTATGCVVLDQAQCEARPGQYLGDGTACEPDPCATVPVMVSQPYATRDDTGVTVGWSTMLGLSGVEFRIERAVSVDGGLISADDAIEVGRLAGSETGTDGRLLFHDDTVQEGVTYAYWIVELEQGVESNRHGPYFVQIDAAQTIASLSIGPNPVRELVELRFLASPGSSGRFEVRDVAGRTVHTERWTSESRGAKELSWNLTSDRGDRVANGVYYCSIEGANGLRLQRTIVVAR